MCTVKKENQSPLKSICFLSPNFTWTTNEIALSFLVEYIKSE